MSEFTECQRWIETVTNGDFDSSKSFAANLQDGTRLCELINAIQPGSVGKIYRGGLAFKQMENISLFLRGCQQLGMPKDDCFATKDLFEENNLGNVIGCLEGLGGLCQANNISGIPTYGKNKYATANKRVWTEEQLKAQKEQDTGTMLNQGSVGIMERTQVTRSGINFGNDVAGAGSNEATMVNTGSSGIMERISAKTSGITFGNDVAGAGSGEATMVNQGSTGTMERADIIRGGITFGKIGRASCRERE